MEIIDEMDKKANPYDLDFTKECTEYREQKTRLVPFAKSEFIYSCKIGTDVTLPSKNNRQMILTMELVQKPKSMSYKGFGCPRNMLERSSFVINPQKLAKLRSDSETEGHLDSEGKLLNHGDSESDDGNVDENAFRGNMFKNDGVIQGQLKRSGIDGGIYDPSSGTEDQVLVTLWDIGGVDQRYKRIVSNLVPFPPVKDDQKCYMTHSGDAVYWLAKQSEKPGDVCLVVYHHLQFDFNDKDQLSIIPFTKYDLNKLQGLKISEQENSAPQTSRQKKGSHLKNLTGSSLSFGNKLLTFQMKKYNQKGQAEKYWIFWNIQEEKMMRDPLDSRIEGVFYPRETENDFSWANSKPEHAYVIANEEYKAMFIEDKHHHHHGHHKLKDKNAGEQKGHYEHRKYVKLYNMPFEMSQSQIMEYDETKHKKNAQSDFARKILESYDTLKTISIEEFKKAKVERLETMGKKKRRQSQAPKQKDAENNDDDEQVNEDEERALVQAATSKQNKQMPDRQFAHNDNFSIFVMINAGRHGEQHKITCWNIKDMFKGWKFQQRECSAQHLELEPIIEYRPGNMHVEISANSHNSRVIFMVQTTQANVITSKPFLQDVEGMKKGPIVPDITLTDVDRNMGIDVWYEPSLVQDSIKSVGRSSADQFLNCNQITGFRKWRQNERDNQLLDVSCAKIKTMDIQLMYPVICSNIGDNIMVQLLTQTDETYVLELPYEEMFVTFLNFHDLEGIGLKNINIKGKQTQQQTWQFEESASRIAFMVRKVKFKKDGTSSNSMILKVLEINPFSNKEQIEIKLYTTTYPAGYLLPERFPGDTQNPVDKDEESEEESKKQSSAKKLKRSATKNKNNLDDISSNGSFQGFQRQKTNKMSASSSDSEGESEESSEHEDDDAGVRDDFIHRAFSVKINSAKGPDIAYVCQYNDCIIFDCITNTTQQPLQFPRLDNEFDNNIGFVENLEPCRSEEMIRVPMIMDDDGAIYFMMRKGKREIVIYRHNKEAVMGDDDFIQNVASIPTEFVYFMVQYQNKFYVMDAKLNVRRYLPDKNSHVFIPDKIFGLQKHDRDMIEHVDFDEYIVSNKCFHRDKQVFFLREPIVDSTNATWYSEEITREDLDYEAGPIKFHGADCVAYLQSAPEDPDDNRNIAYRKQGIEPPKGSYLVIMPMADHGHIDVLPQYKQNHFNCVTFINDHHVLCNYANRWMVFQDDCEFLATVDVDFCLEKAKYSTEQKAQSKLSRMKLEVISDNMKYFVFRESIRVPHFEEETPVNKMNFYPDDEDVQDTRLNSASTLEKGKTPTSHSIGMKFYVFELVVNDSCTWIDGKIHYKFLQMPITSTVSCWNNQKRFLTTAMCITGLFSQTQIIGSNIIKDSITGDKIIEVDIETFSKCLKKDAPESLGKKHIYKFHFPITNQLKNREEFLRTRLKNMLKDYDPDDDTTFDRVQRVKNRLAQLKRCWRINEYLIVIYGNQLKYMKLDENDEVISKIKSVPLEITQGLWLREMYTTGVADLIQMLIIEQDTQRAYIITWNFMFNREHSIYQTTFQSNMYTQNQLVRSVGRRREQNFNFFLENGALINLEANVPAQYVDKHAEPICPRGQFYDYAAGQKRVSDDHTKLLSKIHPGKVHHFYSFLDLLYWKRFQIQREQHELNRGKISAISPLIRFVKGISIMHLYSSDVKILTDIANGIKTFVRENETDPLSKTIMLLPIARPIFTHNGIRQTAIHIAFEKQVLQSQDVMMNLITGDKNVSATRLFGDIIDTLINSDSDAVLEFFHKSFIVTDQHINARMLEWHDKNEKEMFKGVPTSFITDDYLQKLVSEGMTETKQNKMKTFEQKKAACYHELFHYHEELELKKDADVEGSNKLQVHAKMLDFDWVFVNNNAVYLIKTLANTENDKIFEQEQIRIFVEFMWRLYQTEIKRLVFWPFMAMFISFVLYASQFSNTTSLDITDIHFIGKMTTLVVFGKMQIKFILFEFIQLREDGLGYFLNFWNGIDWAYITLSVMFVATDINPFMTSEQRNIIGGFAVLAMYIKIFHFLKIFSMFTTFIRMIQDMIGDATVFFAMLLLVISGLANAMLVFNQNRGERTQTDEIFFNHLDSPLLDSVLHAWLLVLGQFDGAETYSQQNTYSLWLVFVLTTMLIQLVFMTLLIAIMSESFARLTSLTGPSTLQSLCAIMEDNIFLVKTENHFEAYRYILWIGSEVSNKKQTAVERKVGDLREYVENRMEQSDTILKRKLELMEEKQNMQDAKNDDKQNDIVSRVTEIQSDQKSNIENAIHVEHNQDQGKQLSGNVEGRIEELNTSFSALKSKVWTTLPDMQRKVNSAVEKMDDQAASIRSQDAKIQQVQASVEGLSNKLEQVLTLLQAQK